MGLKVENPCYYTEHTRVQIEYEYCTPITISHHSYNVLSPLQPQFVVVHDAFSIAVIIVIANNYPAPC